ncbi:hypothetical protein BKA63DRAFT_576868 [Paraphoma chrysanthemicola]|nr:hypothetical protein BKA63DRAFT_576868 [Paraphoma chrysanthemicola]
MNHTPTDTYLSTHIDLQSDPPPVFHFMKFAKLMPFRFVIVSHIPHGFTKSNLLQLVVMPGCVGLGVCTPFDGLVGVGVGILGVCPKILTQAYYPDGSFPTDYVYVPCSGTEHTSCCIPSEGDQCLSNGLCYYPGGEYLFQGACTDKNWNSPGCFNHCTNKTNSYADSYDQMVKCGNDRYCCYSDGSTCCNDDSKVFTFSNLSVIKDLATTTRKTGGYSAPTAATATGTLRSGSSSVSRASTTSAEVKAQATGTAPTNTAAFPTSTSPSSQTTADESSTTHTFSKTAIIAASVGAMLFFVLLVVAFWFFIRRHYRKKLSPSSKEQGFPLSSDGFQRLSDKSPRPVEVPAPLHAPPPLYQPPAYQSPPPAVHGAVEIDSSYLPPSRNQWGQPVFEAPAQPYRHV